MSTEPATGGAPAGDGVGGAADRRRRRRLRGGAAALAWALAEAARRGADVEVLSAFPVDFYWTDPYLLDPQPDRRRPGRHRGPRAGAGRRGAAGPRGRGRAGRRHGAGRRASSWPARPRRPSSTRPRAPTCWSSAAADAARVRSTVLGSVALHCATHARCPVVVVHPLPAGARGSRHGSSSAWTTPTRPRAALGRRSARPPAWAPGRRGPGLRAAELLERHLRAGGAAGRRDARSRPSAAARPSSPTCSAPSADGGRRRSASSPWRGRPAEVLARQAEGAALLVVGSRSRSRCPAWCSARSRCTAWSTRRAR